MTGATVQNEQARIAAVRRFNRYYTRQIGVLRKTFLDSPYSLGEARVLYEIASCGAPTARDISRSLDLDPGYLSRVLRNFEKRGLIRKRTSAKDGRQSHLTLTPRGRKSFTPLDARSQRATAAMLAKLAPADQARLIAAMTTIEALLEGQIQNLAHQRQYILRQPRPGEHGWIAEIAGEKVGAVMLANDGDGVARFRLLFVEPEARGLGIGVRLVDEAIRFARGAGYRKITLWTHSVLTAARHIYQSAGFKLMRSEEHQSWGQPVVSEHWDLQL